MQYWNKTEVSTTQKAVDSVSPTLVSIKIAPNGDNIVKAFLVVVVSDLVQSFNVGKNMDAKQIAFLVQSILKDFYYLKLDELKLCFENIKKGKYGKVFDRLDTATIYDFINAFLDERMECLFDKNHNNEQSDLSNFKDVNPKVLEVLRSAVDSTSIEPKQMKKRVLSEQEMLEQDILKEFDEIHKLKPYDGKEIMRTIEYNGVNLTQSEFLKVRLTEFNNL